jgi:hypothetical protein
MEKPEEDNWMVTWEDLLTSFVSQAPWALVILIVVIVMHVRLRDELNGRINRLERRIDSLERLLLGIAAILVSKGLLAGEEFEFLRSISEMPEPKSKCYTKADEEELRRL